MSVYENHFPELELQYPDAGLKNEMVCIFPWVCSINNYMDLTIAAISIALYSFKYTWVYV